MPSVSSPYSLTLGTSTLQLDLVHGLEAWIRGMSVTVIVFWFVAILTPIDCPKSKASVKHAPSWLVMTLIVCRGCCSSHAGDAGFADAIIARNAAPNIFYTLTHFIGITPHIC
ncbi:hypothetical protein V8B97DRAFT_1920503 [Scleroderma yunnanense]